MNENSRKLNLLKSYHLFKITLFFVACCLISNAALAQNLAAQFSVKPKYEYTYSEKFIEGGGDFRLITRIWLPIGEGPWPVVMTRTPYGKATGVDDNSEAKEYVKRGLGYIIQYCRGKGGSEGIYQPYDNEREDGIAFVNWLAKQSWCKSIGIFGGSYTAATGWIIANQLPDKVKGLYLQNYGVDRFISFYKDGLFRQDVGSGWALQNANEIINKPPRGSDAFFDLYRFMPQIEMDVNFLGAKLPWYRDWITYTDYNNKFWDQGFWHYLKKAPGQIKVPVTLVSGLYDHHLEGMLLGYERLNKKTRKQSRLIIGPWNHSGAITPKQHNPKHAQDVSLSVDQFEWLYSVVAKGVIPKSEVKVYFIEDDKWITLNSWPIKTDKTETYYFTKQPDSKNQKAFVLTTENRTSTDEIRYVYDPKNPVLSNGGETLLTSSNRRGSLPQKEIGYRNDVISFISPALTEDLKLAGKISVKLSVSTDVDDTSFAFTVSEVMPNGSTYNIRSGITTLAYRNNSLGDRQSYIPNDVVEIMISTVPITWDVKAGNRIRVDITSSNFPEYSIHSNYAGVWSLQTKTRIANQVIYLGGKYKSCIIFPTAM
jgi:putative CocE/NonD family hydrolase